MLTFHCFFLVESLRLIYSSFLSFFFSFYSESILYIHFVTHNKCFSFKQKYIEIDRWRFELNSRTSCWPTKYKLNYFTWQTDSRIESAHEKHTYDERRKSKSQSGIRFAHSISLSLTVSLISCSFSQLVSLLLCGFLVILLSFFHSITSQPNFETRYDKLRW